MRLHPEDVPAAAALADEHPGLRFVADPSLDRGDAMADLPDGRVDARIGARARPRARRLRGGDA